MENSGEKKKLPTWAIVLIILGVVGFLGIAGVGVLAALAIHGTTKYLAAAKGAEGRNSVMAIAHGMQAAGMREDIDPATGKIKTGVLPPSSKPIPASLADVKGKKYMSSSTEWSSDPAFKAARFEMTMPQYFQYSWESKSPNMGTVHALADLDGDGTAEVNLEVDVTCTTTPSVDCKISPLREK